MKRKKKIEDPEQKLGVGENEEPDTLRKLKVICNLVWLEYRAKKTWKKMGLDS